MSSSEWKEFFDFTSHILYLFVAFMSGVVMGYILECKKWRVNFMKELTIKSIIVFSLIISWIIWGINNAYPS